LEAFSEVCAGRGALEELLAGATRREGHSTSTLRPRMVRRELVWLHIVYRALALHGGSWHRNRGYVVVDGAQSLRVVLEKSRTKEVRCGTRGATT
jgi:hypothetical protein